MPKKVLARAKNPEFEPDRFLAAAPLMANNQLVFLLYGVDSEHVIQEAVIGYFDGFDRCVYVDNLFGTDFKNKPLLEALQYWQEQYQAKAVKLVKSEKLDLGGK